MRRTAATLGTAVLLAGLLAACSGNEPDETSEGSGAASASPTASSSTHPSPSPTITKPEPPAAMDKKDAAGAEAAAVYFATLWTYTMTTGDTDEWEAMSGSHCGFCKSGLEQSREVAKNNYIYEGGNVTAHVIQRYERDQPTGIWPVDIESSTTPVTISKASGEKVYSSEHEVNQSRFEVGLLDGNWKVITVAEIPEAD